MIFKNKNNFISIILVIDLNVLCVSISYDNQTEKNELELLVSNVLAYYT